MPKTPPRPGDIRMMIQTSVREVLRDTLFPLMQKQNEILKQVNGLAFVSTALVELLVDKGVFTREELNKKAAMMMEETKAKREAKSAPPPAPKAEPKVEEKSDDKPAAGP